MCYHNKPLTTNGIKWKKMKFILKIYLLFNQQVTDDNQILFYSYFKLLLSRFAFKKKYFIENKMFFVLSEIFT